MRVLLITLILVVLLVGCLRYAETPTVEPQLTEEQAVQQSEEITEEIGDLSSDLDEISDLVS